VVGEIKKGRYLYYRCTRRRGPCREPYIRQEELDHVLVQELCRTVALAPPAVAALTEAAELLAGTGPQAEDTERPAHERQLQALDRKLDALLDLRLAGHLADTEFAAKREELTLEQARVRERLKTLELPQPDPRGAVEWFVSTCNRVETVFLEGQDGEIREFLRLVGSNYRLGGRKIIFEPVEPFTIAAQVRKCPQWSATESDVRKILAHVQALTEPSEEQSAALSAR
jgi:hypothetical protein